MFERNIGYSRVDMMDPLAIPTNVKPHVPCNDAVHMRACLGKSVIQINGVPFGTKACDIFGALGHQFRQIPGFQSISKSFGQGSGRQNQNIVKKPLHAA